MNITIVEKTYQRNGVSGRGFMQVKFQFSAKDEPKGVMLIAILPVQDSGKIDPTECFVINPLDFSDQYRGDNFGEAFTKIKKLLD